MAEPAGAGAEDPLAVLREHVRSAQQAAERLAAQVRPGGEDEPPAPGATPPSGWAGDGERETAAELHALVDLVESLRSMLPEDLRDQLTEVVRQLLLLVRALIDWLVARMEHDGRGREVAVEDIPVI